MTQTTMTVFSGRTIDLLNPKPEDIQILDIAHALSNEVRFAGQARRAYTVAQHSVICSYLVEPRFALEALLHDAHEAYLKDIHAPLRHALKGSVYESLVGRFDALIRAKFLLPEKLSPEVDEADQLALCIEYNSLMPAAEGPPRASLPKLPPTESHEAIKNRFLDRYHELSNGISSNDAPYPQARASVAGPH